METREFNIELFDIKLDTEWVGRNFIYYDELASTNSFLMQEDKNSFETGTVVLAEAQTEGKGRLDRNWNSNKGMDLTFSVLFRGSKLTQQVINFINLGAAVAVAKSIEGLFFIKADLKWPNDVLAGGKKICGILTEASFSGNRADRVVTGIGINVNTALFPGKYKLLPTSVRNETGKIAERERLLAEVLRQLEAVYEKAVHTPDELRAEWRANCRMLGERIGIAAGDREYFGVFEDIDENGFMLLRTQNGIEQITYGDVSLL